VTDKEVAMTMYRIGNVWRPTEATLGISPMEREMHYEAVGRYSPHTDDDLRQSYISEPEPACLPKLDLDSTLLLRDTSNFYQPIVKDDEEDDLPRWPWLGR